MFRVEEDGQFRGEVTFKNVNLNTDSVENKHVTDDAAIEPGKLRHQHRAMYAQESATAAAAESRTVHVVKGAAGEVKTIKFGCVTPCTVDAEITIDLEKDGVSILTGVITLDNSQAAFELVSGTIDTEAVVAGDVLEIVVAVAAGGGALGEGVFGYVDVHEDES